METLVLVVAVLVFILIIIGIGWYIWSNFPITDCYRFEAEPLRTVQPCASASRKDSVAEVERPIGKVSVTQTLGPQARGFASAHGATVSRRN